MREPRYSILADIQNAIDLRYNGQFRSKHDVVLPDGRQLDKLRTYNVALSFGYLF